MERGDENGGGRQAKTPPAITFRRFEQTDVDVDALLALCTGEAARFLRFEPMAGRDDALRFVREYIIPHPWYRVICLSGSGIPVGSINLRPEDAGGGRRRVAMGYSVDPRFAGQGIATAAVRMAAAAALGEWEGVERVEVATGAENWASRRVLEKAGLTREAVLRKYVVWKGETKDVAVYSFLPHEIINS